MKKVLVLVLVLITTFSIFALGTKEKVEFKKVDKVKDLSTMDAKLSYGMPSLMVKQLQRDFNVDKDLFLAGLNDYFNEELKMSEDEIMKTLGDFYAEKSKENEKKLEELKVINKEKQDTFLKENALKEGVLVTDDGVQYRFDIKGDGKLATIDDKVLMDYELQDLDGNVIDSSYQRGEPTEFALKSLIPGMISALKVSPEGSKLTAWIPSEIGYGENGSASVQPNSLLIFNMEVHKVL